MPFDIGDLPRADLARTLREAHDEVLSGLKPNIFALCAGYRLACLHIARRGRIPRYLELPRRLSTGQGRPGCSREGAALDGRTWATICARLSLALRRAGESQLKLVPPKDEMFEDPSLERRRREVLYTAQVGKLDQLAAKWEMTNEKEGPKTKPVYCASLKMWFPSGRDAARFINKTTDGNKRGKDIRTAIVRNARCAGLRFSYTGPADSKPTARIVLAGNQRPVICIELGESAFPSLTKAAAFVGVSPQTMKKALDGDGKIGEFTFEYFNKPATSAETFPASLFAVA